MLSARTNWSQASDNNDNNRPDDPADNNFVHRYGLWIRREAQGKFVFLPFKEAKKIKEFNRSNLKKNG